MVGHHGPPRRAHGPHGIVPGHSHGSRPQAVGQDSATPEAESPDQSVEVVDVAVQGRLAHAQVLGHPGEGHGVQPLGVGQGRRALHHLLRVQGPSAHPRILLLDALTFQLGAVLFS